MYSLKTCLVCSSVCFKKNVTCQNGSEVISCSSVGKYQAVTGNEAVSQQPFSSIWVFGDLPWHHVAQIRFYSSFFVVVVLLRFCVNLHLNLSLADIFIFHDNMKKYFMKVFINLFIMHTGSISARICIFDHLIHRLDFIFIYFFCCFELEKNVISVFLIYHQIC